MLSVSGRAAIVLLAVLSCLGLLACDDKPKEFKPQFRPSMATSPVLAHPIDPLPPRVVRRPLDLERYKDAKAPVVPLVPGKSICRECKMSQRKARLLNAKRRLRPRAKRLVNPRPGGKKHRRSAKKG